MQPRFPSIARPRGHEAILRRRSDLSFFLVHLTKEGEGSLASERLTSILEPDDGGYCTLKGTPQGFFSRVGAVAKDSDLSECIRGVAFTEAPVQQIKHFATPIEAACRRYSRFGLVFEQDFIRRNRGNPCFYVSTFSDQDRRRALIQLAEDDCLRDANWKEFLLFFNIFGTASAERPLDFYWEREWRVPGDLRFLHEDVFVGLCPSEEDDEGRSWLKYLSATFPAILFIDPEWSDDEILRALRRREGVR